MEFRNISEKELEKINFIFNLMNKVSNSSLDEYIKPMMKRYRFIAKTTNYSIETIRKILSKTKTYRYVKVKNYSLKIYYYDSRIYLNKLNNKRIKQQKEKETKCLNKHLEVSKIN